MSESRGKGNTSNKIFPPATRPQVNFYGITEAQWTGRQTNKNNYSILTILTTMSMEYRNHKTTKGEGKERGRER